MKRRVNSLLALLCVFSFGLVGCKESPKDSPSPSSESVREPKSEAGRNVAAAKRVASEVEEHDKKVKEQAEGLFEK